MIRIKLKKPEKRGKEYEVFFDSGARFRFANQRKAEDFLTTISGKCTDALVFINHEYSYLHQHYRDLYFYFKTWEERKHIEDSFDFIRNKMAFLLFRTSQVDYNYFVIKGIEQMLLELQTVYTLLTPVAISRRNTSISCIDRVKSDILGLFLSNFLKFEKELIKQERVDNLQRLPLRKIS